MISVLVPSRGRPASLGRLRDSLAAQTTGEWELIARVDRDDPELRGYERLGLDIIVGDRIVLSAAWNECYAAARGDLVFHCGDDVVVRTRDWDGLVGGVIPRDRIALVHGDDGDPTHGSTFGTHCIVTREWVAAVGYFVPPYFASDWNDTWLNELANGCGRRIWVPIYTEHLHPALGKAEWDQTHAERLERHRAEDCDAIYRERAPERLQAIERLRARIEETW